MAQPIRSDVIPWCHVLHSLTRWHRALAWRGIRGHLRCEATLYGKPCLHAGDARLIRPLSYKGCVSAPHDTGIVHVLATPPCTAKYGADLIDMREHQLATLDSLRVFIENIGKLITSPETVERAHGVLRPVRW